MKIVSALALAVLLAGNAPPSTGQPARCTLRVALVSGNAAQATRAANGEMRGISVDVARAIADRWNRSLTLVTMTPPEIIAGLERGEIDLGFVAATAGRGGAIGYSRPYMQVQQTVMVRADSAIASVRDLDRAGMRVGATKGDSVALFLNRTMTNATLVPSEDASLAEAVMWLQNGSIQAFAANRQRLNAAVLSSGNLRVLPDNLFSVQQAIAVPASKSVTLAAVDQALDALRASGSVQRSIRRAKVAGVLTAAGPAPQRGKAIVPACP